MLRRYLLIINFFLVLVSLFLVSKIYEVWKLKDRQSETSQAVKQNKTPLPTLKTDQVRKNPRQSYQGIVDKDLFRPERTEWKPETESEPGKAASAPSPPLKLYGIVISGGFKHAWIEEEGKGAKLRRISEGDTVGGWKVKDIEFSSLNLINGKRVAKYNLIEPGKPKQRTIPKSLTAPPKPSASQQQKPIPPQQLPPAPQSTPIPPPPQSPPRRQ